MVGGEAMSQSVSIGFGCSSRATVEDVVNLIQSCAIELTPGSIVATLDRCSSMGEAVAASLGLRLMLFPADMLAHIPGVQTYSSFASAKVGTPSVAEASALASLGPTAQLTLPRQTGHLCTCAVAVIR